LYIACCRYIVGKFKLRIPVVFYSHIERLFLWRAALGAGDLMIEARPKKSAGFVLLG